VERGNATAETLEQREAASLVARARVSVAEDALRLAQADKELAEAQRRELQVRLARTEIKAPAAGTISRRDARLGALVSSAAEPLFRIIGAGTIEVEADVPESSLGRLRVGQTALVHPAGMEQPVPARVRLVSPEVNRTSRLGRVRLSVNPVPGLAVGAFARGTVEVDRRSGALVPFSAVLHRPEGAIVQVVRNGIVETRPVVVGLKAGGKAEIRKGIEPGEQVVAISGTFVRDGDRVTPVPQAAVPLSAAPGQGTVQTSSIP
jgi:RND family efflux transporter MFP subunit